MIKKILIATSGTGGHIFPALYLAQELRRQGHEVVIAGTVHKFKARIEAEGFQVELLDMQGFVSSKLMRFPSACWKLIKGFFHTRRFIKQWKPVIVVGFGGYSSFPFVFNASMMSIPTVIHEQNRLPGQANLWLAPYVNKIAVSFDQTDAFPKVKTVVTGCPCLHPDPQLSREQALSHFGLSATPFTILVVGGSQGSQRINEVFSQTLQDLTKQFDVQAIHMTGPGEEARYQHFYHEHQLKGCVVGFIDHMVAAYTAADLVVARAGAMTVAEVTSFGKSTIFIPYPHAQNHQRANAEVVVGQNHSQIIDEKQLSKKTLEQMILQIKGATMQAVSQQQGNISITNAHERLACVVLGE